MTEAFQTIVVELSAMKDNLIAQLRKTGDPKAICDAMVQKIETAFPASDDDGKAYLCYFRTEADRLTFNFSSALSFYDSANSSFLLGNDRSFSFDILLGKALSLLYDSRDLLKAQATFREAEQ